MRQASALAIVADSAGVPRRLREATLGVAQPRLTSIKGSVFPFGNNRLSLEPRSNKATAVNVIVSPLVTVFYSALWVNGQTRLES